MKAETAKVSEGRPADNILMIQYRNGISWKAQIAPRLDDIRARFLIEELQDKIAEALKDFDEKRNAL